MLGLKVFGSRVVARATDRKTGKLDMNNIRQGIFVGFTGTEKNIWYIDDATKKPKIGSLVKFDKAHMMVPAQYAPIAAQALQRVGYNVNEIMNEKSSTSPLTIYLHSKTAKSPHQHNNKLSVPLDINPTAIKP